MNYTTFADSCWKITSDVSSELQNDARKLTRLHHNSQWLSINKQQQ